MAVGLTMTDKPQMTTAPEAYGPRDTSRSPTRQDDMPLIIQAKQALEDLEETPMGWVSLDRVAYAMGIATNKLAGLVKRRWGTFDSHGVSGTCEGVWIRRKT